MSIIKTCACGKRLRIPDDQAARRHKCPQCGEVLASTADIAASPPACEPEESTAAAPNEAPARRRRAKKKRRSSFLTRPLMTVGALPINPLVLILVVSSLAFLAGGGYFVSKNIRFAPAKRALKPILYEGRTTAEWLGWVKNMRTGKAPFMPHDLVEEKLACVGPDPLALGDLLAALKDPDLSDTAAKILQRFTAAECKQAISVLSRALDDDNVKVQIWSARLLCRVGGEAKESLPAFVKLLKHPDAEMRRSAVEAIGNLKSDGESALPSLVEFLGDRKVRTEVVHALAQFGPAVKRLPNAKQLVQEMVRVLKLEEIEVHGLAGSSPPFAEIAARHAQVQTSAVRVLGELGVEAKETAGLLRTTQGTATLQAQKLRKEYEKATHTHIIAAKGVTKGPDLEQAREEHRRETQALINNALALEALVKAISETLKRIGERP